MEEQISPHAMLFSAAFMIWMLVDAWRRRAPMHWYFIIAVMPFGAIVYFFFMKLRDYRGAPKEVQANAVPSSARNVSPSGRPLPVNLDRADLLEEREEYAEAESMYRAALSADPSDKRAMHGLGRCLLGEGKAVESLVYFEQLLELDREFANYGAALDYADALFAGGHQSDAVELLERLADVTGRINHRLAYAHYLAEAGQIDRARTEIGRAIAEGSGPLLPFNERHRQWVERGRQMLAELAERQAPSDDER
jgi:hypothetical protein